MPALFAVTLFLGAGLLFLVQPMAAKMILSKFGGAPAVWNTSMVFFQATLLAGYGYAHLSTSRLSPRRQRWVHLALLLIGLMALPLVTLPVVWARDWAPPPGLGPVLPLLGLLLVSVGVPFFVVSTTAPLLQRWFTATGHGQAQDPYFLYAASNAGSLLGLLAYPALVERNLTLREQGWLWAAGFLMLTALAAAICRLAPARPRAVLKRARFLRQAGAVSDPDGALSWQRRLRWLGLAFVPSSLMLGVTTYATTDIAPVPLLWVIPLALYLLTFIVAFARLPVGLHRLTTALLPGALLLLLIVYLGGEGVLPMGILLGCHLLAFFVIALYSHGELARDRPSSESLTEYYLWLSLGGVLGGVFNGLVAPVVFPVVAEYPSVAVLICVLDRRPAGARAPDAWRGAMLPIGLGLVAGVVAVSANHFGAPRTFGLLAVGSVRLSVYALLLGLPALLCWGINLWVARRPVRFGLGLGVVLAGLMIKSAWGRAGETVLTRGRSFFGPYAVVVDDRFVSLFQGRTLHGRQQRGPDGGPAPHPRPLIYYYPSGPIGQVFAAAPAVRAGMPVAVVGLGSGSLAAYGRSGQELVFYEIDPAVARIAWDDHYFTFLRDCPTRCRVVLGDGRLSLARAPAGHYGLIVLDAFSSDAVPVHLLTKEAIRLYFDKLAPGGVVAFNLSNRYLDLRRVLGALAWDLGLACRQQDDSRTAFDPKYRQDFQDGRAVSTWLIMARRAEDFGAQLTTDVRWLGLRIRPGVPAWTDDYSNLLSVLHRVGP